MPFFNQKDYQRAMFVLENLDKVFSPESGIGLHVKCDANLIVQKWTSRTLTTAKAVKNARHTIDFFYSAYNVCQNANKRRTGYLDTIYQKQLSATTAGR